MKNLRVFVYIIICIIVCIVSTRANTLDGLIVPSIMGRELDAWYYTLPGTSPKIISTDVVFRNQPFNVLVFLKDYTIKDNYVNVIYDIQVFDPDGKMTEDNIIGINAYKGNVKQTNILLLCKDRIMLVFTDKYLFGKYKIKIILKDQNSGLNKSIENEVELVPFSTGEKFTSLDEFNKWATYYYQNIEPGRIINTIKQFVNTDKEWINENYHYLTFITRVIDENEFLIKYVKEDYLNSTQQEQKKFLLIYALMRIDNTELIDVLNNEYIKIYENFKNMEKISTEGELDSLVQLDMLWMDFFATGKYQPVKRIISALKLGEYSGTIDKIKNKEIAKTEESMSRAMLEGVYKGALWSIKNNCVNHPLVYKYCIYIYKNESLDPFVKEKLLSLIKIVSDETSQ